MSECKTVSSSVWQLMVVEQFRAWDGIYCKFGIVSMC